MTATENVQVDVENALARVRPDVPDEAVAALGDALFARDMIGCLDQGGEYRAIFGLRRMDAGNMGTWDDERVEGRLRVYIAEGDDGIVAIDLGAGDLAGDDAAEEAVFVEWCAHSGGNLLFVVVRSACGTVGGEVHGHARVNSPRHQV